MGLLLNLHSPNLPVSENENVFGLIVSTSMAMIVIGFTPSLLKWKKDKISRAVMVVALIAYLLVTVRTIMTYSET